MAAFPHQLLELAVERSALAHGKRCELQLLGGQDIAGQVGPARLCGIFPPQGWGRQHRGGLCQ